MFTHTKNCICLLCCILSFTTNIKIKVREKKLQLSVFHFLSAHFSSFKKAFLMTQRLRPTFQFKDFYQMSSILSGSSKIPKLLPHQDYNDIHELLDSGIPIVKFKDGLFTRRADGHIVCPINGDVILSVQDVQQKATEEDFVAAMFRDITDVETLEKDIERALERNRIPVSSCLVCRIKKASLLCPECQGSCFHQICDDGQERITAVKNARQRICLVTRRFARWQNTLRHSFQKCVKRSGKDVANS